MSRLWPYLTIVVPVYNEAAHLLDCLTSIAAQDYPPAHWEVWVIDGGSEDGSWEIARAWVERDPRFHLLRNPRRIAAAALNLGIQAGKGEIIARVDGHCILAPDYLTRCVLVLQQDEHIAGVGGPFRGLGDSPWMEAIALGMASPFGAGNAAYRFPNRVTAGDVDTVYLGTYRRKWLERVGGYNETLDANEDYELNYRLRRAGGRIVLDPTIVSQTWVRSTPGALARQFFRYGFWKAQMLKQHPQSLRWRQTAAPALVAGLLLTFLSSLLWPLGMPLLAFLLLIYFIATALATFRICRQHGWRHVLHLPIVFWTMHLAWGLGFWTGLLRRPRRAI